MYELDQKFCNKDGSLNVEVAMRAGREARARHLSEGCGIVRDAATQLILSAWRSAAGSGPLTSLCRMFGERAGWYERRTARR